MKRVRSSRSDPWTGFHMQYMPAREVPTNLQSRGNGRAIVRRVSTKRTLPMHTNTNRPNTYHEFYYYPLGHKHNRTGARGQSNISNSEVDSSENEHINQVHRKYQKSGQTNQWKNLLHIREYSNATNANKNRFSRKNTQPPRNNMFSFPIPPEFWVVHKGHVLGSPGPGLLHGKGTKSKNRRQFTTVIGSKQPVIGSRKPSINKRTL